MQWLEANKLAANPRVRHGFTGRSGGLSTGPLASWNLARHATEPAQTTAANWRQVTEKLGIDAASLALVSQVHGRRVLHATAPSGGLATLGEGDALVTTTPGLALAIRTADCVPILLAADGGVAAVHAGWRGVAADIAGAAVTALLAATGADPSTLQAAIGPCIRAPVYEVGDDVVDAIAGSGVPRAVFVRPGTRGRPHVDLAAAVAAQLGRMGVQDIEDTEMCTFTDERWYSHRRDGPITGRQAAVIVLHGGPS